MAVNCFQSVFRTRRRVAAGRERERGYCKLIGAEQPYQNNGRDASQSQVRGFSFFKVFSMDTNALATSFLSSEKSAVNSDRFGLITTSAMTSGSIPWSRTA